MTTHAILTSHKEWKSFDDRRRKLDAGQRKFLERQAEAQAMWGMRTSEYDAKVEAALLAGEEPPDVKRWPGPFIAPAGSIEVFVNAAVELEAERRAWLAAMQPTIQSAVEVIERDVLARARPLVAELDRLADELASARRAGDLADGAVGLGHHHAGRVTVETLIAATKNKTLVVSRAATDSPSQIVDRSEVGAL